MTREDKEFMTMFMIVLGILAALAVTFLVIAQFAAATIQDYDPTSVAFRAIEERIEPVGGVYLSTVPRQEVEGAGGEALTQVVAADTGSATGGGAEVSGEAVYNKVCVACHASGVLNAPIVGKKAAWSPRIAKGIEVLYQHAIGGFKAMPPRGGGTSLSNAQVKAAVDYMVAQVKG